MDNRREHRGGTSRNGTDLRTDGHTEVVGNTTSDQALVVWVLIAVAAMVSVNTAVELHGMFSRKTQPLAEVEEATLQVAINQRLDEAWRRVDQLIERGEHLEAALLLADIAAAQRVLLPQTRRTSREVIKIADSAALMQLRLAGEQHALEAYTTLLKLRYPD